MKYPLLAARVFERPLLIEQRKLNAILSVLGPRMEFALPAGAERKAWDDDGDDLLAPPARYVVDRGVARIKIIGTLVHRSAGMAGWSGLLSYEDLTLTLREALADDNAKSILFEIDSGGGEVDGVFDLADEIYAARDAKPMVAVAKDCAASAAYLLAAATGRIVVTQTAEIGSVGVIASTVDYSQQNQQMGIAVTYIYAGDHKTDGWPDIPLSKAAKARFQADVDKTYRLFVEKIAQFRSMNPVAVKATEALTYIGSDGVAIGFADEVSTIDTVMSTLADKALPPAEPVIGPSPGDDAENTEHDMTVKPTPAEGASAATNNQPAAPPAPVDVNAVRQQASAEAKTRIGAIIGLEEAKGRDELARHFAFETDMTVDQAKAALAKAPVPAAPERQPDRLDAAMRAAGNPKVGPNGGEADDEDPAATANAIVASVRGPARTAQRSN